MCIRDRGKALGYVDANGVLQQDAVPFRFPVFCITQVSDSVYYVGGSDNTLKLIVTQGNYNAILSCKIDNATIHPETPDDNKDNNEPVAAQPYVIISNYSYGKGDLVAGETRNVTMTFRNTSKTMAVENMMVTITMPDAMMLTSSSNSFYCLLYTSPSPRD